MSETALWALFKRHMSKHGHWERVENGTMKGMPDVVGLINLGGSIRCTQTIWIELKRVPDWPQVEHTELKIKHFTNEQRVWHREWSYCGGKSFVFLKVEKPDNYLLFNNPNLQQLGHANKMDTIALALSTWKGSFNGEYLIHQLRKYSH